MKRKLAGGIIVCLSLLLAVGSATFFGPCVHEDGSFGSCHWAGRMITAEAVLLAVLGLLMILFSGREVQTGLSAAAVLLALMTFLTPEKLIGLCMMSTMRCQMLLKPACRILSSGILIIAAVQTVWQSMETGR